MISVQSISYVTCTDSSVSLAFLVALTPRWRLFHHLLLTSPLQTCLHVVWISNGNKPLIVHAVSRCYGTFSIEGTTIWSRHFVNNKDRRTKIFKPASTTTAAHMQHFQLGYNKVIDVSLWEYSCDVNAKLFFILIRIAYRFHFAYSPQLGFLISRTDKYLVNRNFT